MPLDWDFSPKCFGRSSILPVHAFDMSDAAAWTYSVKLAEGATGRVCPTDGGAGVLYVRQSAQRLRIDHWQ